MAIDEQVFQPDFLQRLRRFFLEQQARRVRGPRGSRRSGAAISTREFKDHRAYSPGDDFRAIDWNLFARHEKLYIRTFEEVLESHVHVLIDRSQSMCSPYASKRIHALRLAAAISYLALFGHHRLSLFSFGVETKRELPPIVGPGHVQTVLQRLSELPFTGTTELRSGLAGFRPRRDRPGVVFVISDLLGDRPGDAEEAIARAISWRAETHFVHLIDPREAHPDFQGGVDLESVETGQTEPLHLTAGVLDRYEAAFRSFGERLRAECDKRRFHYLPLMTDCTLEASLRSLLSRGFAFSAPAPN